MNQLNNQITQLATTTVDVTRWSRHLAQTLSQSLKDVVFFVAYIRTKGKDLTKFIGSFTNNVNTDTEWYNTCSDVWNKFVREERLQ